MLNVEEALLRQLPSALHVLELSLYLSKYENKEEEEAFGSRFSLHKIEAYASFLDWRDEFRSQICFGPITKYLRHDSTALIG